VFAHVAVFTKHATLEFFQGTTLEDPDGILEGAGKGHRQIKVTAPDSVPKANSSSSSSSSQSEHEGTSHRHEDYS
jgi:Domain of unknown function (DU1801)